MFQLLCYLTEKIVLGARFRDDDCVLSLEMWEAGAAYPLKMAIKGTFLNECDR